MVGVGQRIGNYRVLRKLGQGGMGAVYEAVHEVIGHRAAIKVLLPDFATDQQNILRFFNEARAVNIIQHPGLVGVFESGRLEDSAAYIVMEFLEGELLSSRLVRAGRLELHATLNLIRQIAAALTAAHQKRIVHRDLKPENVMLVPDPEHPDGERVKVFDFGIAKLAVDSLGPQANGGVLRTQTGMIMGTPTHMAPEQCRGAGEVDHKADVYSLGVMFYQMLVGYPPFNADSPGELMSMHLRDQPPWIREQDARIPEPVANLVHAMLEKAPHERPEMAEVVSAIESFGAIKASGAAGAVIAPLSNIRSERLRVRNPPATLQQASGQSILRNASRHFAVAIGGSIFLVIAAAVVLFWPSRQIRWAVLSSPSDAEVVSVDTGMVLGRTPWTHQEKAATGTLRVVVRSPGYYDEKVVLDYAHDRTQTVYLSKQVAAAKPPAPPPPPPSQRMVHWVIGSKPGGAEVMRLDTGDRLCVTPCDIHQPGVSGSLRVVLRLAGRQEQTFMLDLNEDTNLNIGLKRAGRAAKRVDDGDVPLVDSEDEPGSPSGRGSGSRRP